MKRCWLLLLPLLSLAACSAPRTPLPPPPSAETLLQQLQLSSHRWQQVELQAEVGIQRQGHYLLTHQQLLAEQPQRLRLNILTPFDQQVMQLGIIDGQLQVLVNSLPPQFYQGALDQQLLACLTRLPLTADRLIGALLYSTSLFRIDSASVERTEERFVLHLADDYRERLLQFDGQLRLREVLYLHERTLQLQVAYADFAAKDGFPRRIVLEVPAEQTRLTFDISAVQLNQPAADKRFQLRPPLNAVPLFLPDSGLQDCGK